MKEYLLLECPKNNHYSPMKINRRSSLYSLLSLLFGDFRPWDDSFLIHTVNCYNANFIYHDFANKMLYIGFSEWEMSEGEMHCPLDEEFPNYVNENNSCRMHVDNFLEFRTDWVTLKKELPPFAIIYRDEHEWIHCKGFDSQKSIELFVKNYKPEITH